MKLKIKLPTGRTVEQLSREIVADAYYGSDRM